MKDNEILLCPKCGKKMEEYMAFFNCHKCDIQINKGMDVKKNTNIYI